MVALLGRILGERRELLDGTDGIIGLQAAIFGLHILLNGSTDSRALIFGAVVVGASLGFLIWNWSPAKIFLGDVGSGAVGILMVVGGILLMARKEMSLVGAFLPLAPIFLDASVTLLARALKGARLSDAHREHVYQVLAIGGWGHPRIALAYGAAAASGVWVSYLWPRAGPLVLLGYLAGLAAAGILALRWGSSRRTAGP